MEPKLTSNSWHAFCLSHLRARITETNDFSRAPQACGIHCHPPSPLLTPEEWTDHVDGGTRRSKSSVISTGKEVWLPAGRKQACASLYPYLITPQTIPCYKDPNVHINGEMVIWVVPPHLPGARFQ